MLRDGSRSSVRSVSEARWIREDVRIEGTHHLYRSMDFFEKHKDELEKAICLRLSDLLNTDDGATIRGTRSNEALRQKIKLAQLSTPHWELWQVAEPNQAALNRLKRLGIPPPSPLLEAALQPAHTPPEAHPGNR